MCRNVQSPSRSGLGIDDVSSLTDSVYLEPFFNDTFSGVLGEKCIDSCVVSLCLYFCSAGAVKNTTLVPV